MRTKYLLIIFLFFTACEKIITVETEFQDQRMVIDASIMKGINDDNAEIIVKLSSTIPYFSNTDSSISDANVYVMLEDEKIFLEHNLEKKIFEKTIKRIDYETDYELYVEHNNNIYYSKEKLIRIPKIETVTFGSRKSLQKDEIELLVTFTDLNGIGNYYLWKFGPKGLNNKFDYLVARDTYIEGNKFTFSFFIDKTEYFKINDIVTIELSGITKDCYNYLNILTSQAGAQSGRPFSSANAIVKGKPIPRPGTPESFKVLMRELQSLGLDIGVYTDEGKEVDLMQDINPRRNTPSRPTYESLGTSEYEED